MTFRINTYFATLIVTVAGALATWVIVSVSLNKPPVINNGDESSFFELRESILKQ